MDPTLPLVAAPAVIAAIAGTWHPLVRWNTVTPPTRALDDRDRWCARCGA